MDKKRQFPDTLLIILVILIIFIGLTWIIPAGEFTRTELNGRTIVEPGTYQSVNSQPQGIGAFFMAPIKGFIGAAQIIAFVFLVGGAFSIVTKTGAVNAGLRQILRFSQRRPAAKRWILPLIITLFSLAGSTFGMSEETLVFVLITIPLSLALGYDSLIGVALSFVGAGAGFAGAFINPFTIGVAQGIAELPPTSGMGYRLVVWAVMTLVTILFIMRYAAKLDKDPSYSPVYELDQKRDKEQLKVDSDEPFTGRQKLVLFCLLGALTLLVVGVSQWDWYINEIAGLFIGLGMVAALVARLKASVAVEAFKEGAKDMLTAALVIALAKGLIVVAEDGKIIDTLLNGIALATEGLPKVFTVQIMFIMQSALNFFVPSGSGQAALTMPIMAPLSDLLGISRQTAVLAYQLGDGLSNLVIPTSGVTMGVLAIAKIPYNVWLKWLLPLFIILSILAMLLLLPPVFMDFWN